MKYFEKALTSNGNTRKGISRIRTSELGDLFDIKFYIVDEKTYDFPATEVNFYHFLQPLQCISILLRG